VRLHATAVAAEDDLVAQVDADEARRARVDVEQVLLLVGGQRLDLQPAVTGELESGVL